MNSPKPANARDQQADLGVYDLNPDDILVYLDPDENKPPLMASLSSRRQDPSPLTAPLRGRRRVPLADISLQHTYRYGSMGNPQISNKGTKTRLKRKIWDTRFRIKQIQFKLQRIRYKNKYLVLEQERLILKHSLLLMHMTPCRRVVRKLAADSWDNVGLGISLSPDPSVRSSKATSNGGTMELEGTALD